MRKSRFADEQIVGFLKQAEAGIAVKELCRANGFSDAAFCKWRAKYGSLSIRMAPWDRRAFALELNEARGTMPMSDSVMEELRSGARY